MRRNRLNFLLKIRLKYEIPIVLRIIQHSLLDRLSDLLMNLRGKIATFYKDSTWTYLLTGCRVAPPYVCRKF